MKPYKTKNRRQRRSWPQRCPWHMLRWQSWLYSGNSACLYGIWKQKISTPLSRWSEV